MHKGHIATGSMDGTGSIINVSIGFVPQYVRIINREGLAELEWHESMTDDHGMKTVTAGTLSEISSGGITPYEGTTGGVGKGFSIGADADVNVNGEELFYIAISSDA